MMPGPFEAVALAQAAGHFDAWVKHTAGMSIIHSNTPDKRSFQAGFLTALMLLVEQRKEKINESPPRTGL